MDNYIWTRYQFLIIALFNMINMENIKDKEEQFHQAQIELKGIYKYLERGERIIETNYDKNRRRTIR